MNLREIITDIPFFRSLNNDEIDLIIKSGKRKSVKKGDTVHSPDEICYNMTIVLSGLMYSSKYSISGNEQIVCNLTAGKCFGYPVMFGDHTYPEYIIAESDTELLYLSRDVVTQLFQNTSFNMLFIEMLSAKLTAFSDLVEILSFTSVRERVSKYLLVQVEKQGGQSTIKIKNKTRLAKELGSVRGVVSRTFKLLVDDGIIKQVNDHVIEILDKDKLEEFS